MLTTELPDLPISDPVSAGAPDVAAAELGEEAPIKLCALDADLRIDSLNRIWREQLGAPVSGSAFLEALAEEDRAAAGAALQSIWERGGTTSLEARLELVSEQRWHRFDFRVNRAPGSRPRLIGVATDIALERARSENVNARLRQMALQLLVMRRLLTRRSGELLAVVRALAVIGEMAQSDCTALTALRSGLLTVTAEWSEGPTPGLGPPVNGQRLFALLPFSAPEIQAATQGIPLRPAELRRFSDWSGGAVVAFPIHGQQGLAGLLLVARAEPPPSWTATCVREIGNLSQVFQGACGEELGA